VLTSSYFCGATIDNAHPRSLESKRLPRRYRRPLDCPF
jgi:hypothetical protein